MEDKKNTVVESVMTTDSSSSPFLPIQIIGGQGGKSVSYYSRNGAMLEKIGVWVGEWQVRGVKIWLTNGGVHQLASTAGQYHEFSFENGELIRSLSLWGNGAGSRLGGIKFTTSKSRTFFAHMTKWSLKQEYPIDVGSRVCTGVLGRVGSDVDSMGFAFVKPIRDSVMTSVEYPTIGFEKVSVPISTVDSLTYDNGLNQEHTYEFSASAERTTRETWSKETAIEFAYHTTVKAGIPGLFDVEAGWSLKVSAKSAYAMENSKTETKNWKFNVPVPAETKVKATLTQGEASVDLPYNATVKITTTDGSVLTFPVNGIYRGVTYTEGNFKTEIVTE